MAQEGEIWPPLKQDFFIVFKPEEARLYEQTIYCDITGLSPLGDHTIT